MAAAPVYDVVIIGGGIMGSTTAYYLATMDPECSIAVFEKDPTYQYCSTLRSDGNLRVQFSLSENIAMSAVMMDLIDTFSDEMALPDWIPDPAPRRQGNLFLFDEPGREAAYHGVSAQRELGWETHVLDASSIARQYPAYEAQGIAGGTLGPMDGTVNAASIFEAFRRQAQRHGVQYIAAEVTEVTTYKGRVTGIQTAEAENVAAGCVINCTGGWAKALALTAGIELPVEPVMRTVFVVDTPFDTTLLPSIFLPNGIYAIPEGGTTFEIAWSTPADPVGFDFRFSRAGFDQKIWPSLVETLPLWDTLRVTGGWCGIYAMNTLDGNAILGEWPTVAGMYVANGFSGHGFQHGPAVGRHLAELILGREPTLELDRLSPQRIIENEPLHEHPGRLI